MKKLRNGAYLYTMVMTAVSIIALALLMWLTIEITFTEIAWSDVGFTFACVVVGRAIYTPFGINHATQKKEYTDLILTIDTRRNEIFKHNINQKFVEEIDRHNLINKCIAYKEYLERQICKMTSKNNRDKVNVLENEKRGLMDYLSTLKSRSSYNGEFNIDKVKISYDKTSFASMFSHGTPIQKRGKAYVSNVGLSSVLLNSYAVSGGLIASILIGLLSFQSVGEINAYSVLMFFIKLLSFAMASYGGYKVGNDVIKNVKMPVLTNIICLTTEILTDLGIRQEKELEKEKTPLLVSNPE